MLEEIIEKPEIIMRPSKSIGASEFVQAVVVNIYWERINLFIEVRIDCKEPPAEDFIPDLFAVDRFGNVGARFDFVEKCASIFKFALNITNVGNCSPIPAGDYYLYVCKGDEYFGKCKTSIDNRSGLLDASRSFLYRNRSYAFIVSFLVNDNDESMTMHVMAGKSISAGYAAENSAATLENILM